jgi:hypothetical protein
MTFGALLTTADLHTAIASDEERLADCRVTLEECEEAGLDTAQTLSLLHIVEDHLALLKERRERLLEHHTDSSS